MRRGGRRCRRPHFPRKKGQPAHRRYLRRTERQRRPLLRGSSEEMTTDRAELVNTRDVFRAAVQAFTGVVRRHLVIPVKIWFQNRRTKWKKQDNISNAEAAEHKNQATGKPEGGAAKPKEGAPAKPAQPGAKAAPLAALPGAKLGAGASLPSPSSGEDHSNASVFTAGDGSASESCFGDPTQPPPPPPPHHVLTVSVQDSSRSPTVSPPKTPALAPTPPSVAAPVPMVVDPLPAPTPPTPTSAPAAVSTPPLAVQMQMSAPLAQPELMEAPRPVSPSS
ncbi:nascent polypeptide-associated complex subunit alpha, muscle-specific form-like [Schistocerca gregaria]|uniref:nascent polypeptide-associated complex subunit alpha, muscle-specific form-like n=1 Tax=Schistocerca gregaria TaxID=7010 RepID=UPI00211E4244|nr:nascent polypeptide-associated complex subunit alpha, muscle-specific form-like [Schistocerca gregaria]